MKLVFYNPSIITEDSEMIYFWRLRLRMIQDGVFRTPERYVVDKLTDLSHIESVKDDYCLANSVSDGSFVFWGFAKGKALPLSEKVIVKEVDTVTEKDNPRTENEIEPNDQFFALYDMERDEFYLSSPKKRGFVLSLFNKVTAKDEIKWEFENVYKSASQFAELIRNVKSIRLVSEETKDKDPLSDLGLVSLLADVKSYTIDVKFDAPIADTFVNALNKLLGLTKEGRYKSLVCVGKGDQGIERVFNAESFMERIQLPGIDKNSRGFYDFESVRQALQNRVMELGE